MSLTTTAENRAILLALDSQPAVITTADGTVREMTMLFDEHRDPQTTAGRNPKNPYVMGQSTINLTECVGVVADEDIEGLELQDAQVDILGEVFRISYFDHDDGMWRLELRRF